jgi:hypothetical protein
VSQELEAKRKHLESLETFLDSPAYRGYAAAVKQDILDTKELIIATVPDSFENLSNELLLRGELRCLEVRLTMFEEARTTLKDRIDEIAERELQSATTTKK